MAHSLANAYFHSEDTVNNPVLNPNIDEILEGVPIEWEESEGDLDLSDDSGIDENLEDNSDSSDDSGIDENLEESGDDGND